MLLWFDVGIKRYTTSCRMKAKRSGLWFDVGIKRYTTRIGYDAYKAQLWFDVGIKRYTTRQYEYQRLLSCGLM